MLNNDFSPVLGMQNTARTLRGVLRGGPLIAGVEVSVRYSESHTLNASATRQTLESGAKVSDHVIIEPYSVSVSFEVTNTGDGPAAAKDVFETFKRMLEQRERVELITEHHIYDNMVLTGLGPVHEAPFKGRLKCTANLVQVKQAALEISGRIPQILSSSLNGIIQKTAAAAVSGGAQEGKTVVRSLASKILSKSTNSLFSSIS